MRKIIIIVIALAIVLGFLFWKFAPNFLAKNKQKVEEANLITLNIIGLFEEENLLKPALDEYKKTHPNVDFKYTLTQTKNYPTRVQTKIDQGEELDIFVIHNSWLPMFLKSQSLSSMPESAMTFADYQKDFYPIVSQSFVKDNKIFALPRGIDGLALFYNEDILKSANVEVPQTWEEFKASAVKMTVIDPQTKAIQTAGAALGTTGNVDNWSDIIGLLYLQNPGANLEKPNSPGGIEVLSFFTSFVTDPNTKTWDKNMVSSTQKFAENSLGFYIAPSWRAHQLRQLNPQLNFKTAPMPQLPGKDVSWGTFWGYAVSSKSKNPEAAWDFLKHLTSSETQKQLYKVASDVRLFGLPYSRVELQSQLADDPLVGVFVNKAPTYKSWYLSSDTHDGAINDQMIKYFEDGVNAVLDKGTDPQTALDTTAQGVTQILCQYELKSATECQ